MKKTLLLLTAAVALLAAGCKKSTDGFIRYSDTAKFVAPKPYVITEDFEKGSKTAYAAANIDLSTGPWNFDDALIGSLAADVKSGTWCVRLRNGKITMNFDVSNVSKIIIKHAKYGNDAAAGWTLFISRDKGVSWAQLGAEVQEASTVLLTDSINVATTGPVRFQIRRTSGASGTRSNFDDITFKGLGNANVTIGTPDAPPVDTTSNNSNAANPRPIVVGNDAPPASGDNSNMLFGNPSNAATSVASSDNYLIDAGYYTESYSATRGTPNWVSWHLDNTNTTNATARLDNFAAWSALPPSFYAVQSNSYSGSGFDRGHNCPSADRTSSTAANGATFLMTNMIPQAPQNNQQTWNNLESYLRQQLLNGNEVYIIMGSYGTGGVGSVSSATVNTINGGKVTVPANVWKVAVIIPAGNGDIIRVGAGTRVIAVNTPNVNSINSDWTKYIVTVRQIEQATGYNLLSALPQSVQDVIEVGKDSGI